MPGGYDIICGGGSPVTVLPGTPGKDGEPGAPGKDGAPGTAVTGACTGAQVAGGIAITCNGEFVGIVSDGAAGPQGPAGPAGPGGGTGPGGVCSAEPYQVNNNDKGLKLDCGDRIANFITCPKETNLIEKDTDVLFCNAAGYVGQSAAIRCNGSLFDVNTQFCQRVTSSGAFHVTYHPTDTTTYQKENQAGVTSTIKPLCGFGGTTWVGTSPNYSGITIVADPNGYYDATKRCVRNLVIDTTTVTRYNAAGAIIITGTAAFTSPTAGGANDIDPDAPWSTSWKVLDSGTCFITPSAANGYDVGLKQAGCTFYAAESAPYTKCPTNDALSVDDVKCVLRDVCLYHSTIDNTCIVKEGVSTVGVRGKATLISSGALSDVNFDAGADQAGIYTRDPLVNKWSKRCSTATRNSYYAVNDQFLVSRASFLALNTAAGGGTAVSTAIETQPICAAPAHGAVGDPDYEPAIPVVAFELAFACLRGTLSVDDPKNDGTEWNKPLYCKGTTAAIPATPCTIAGGTTVGAECVHNTANTITACNATSLGVATAVFSSAVADRCILTVSSGTAISSTDCSSTVSSSDITNGVGTWTTRTIAGAASGECILTVSSGTAISSTDCGSTVSSSDITNGVGTWGTAAAAKCVITP